MIANHGGIFVNLKFPARILADLLADCLWQANSVQYSRQRDESRFGRIFALAKIL